MENTENTEKKRSIEEKLDKLKAPKKKMTEVQQGSLLKERSTTQTNRKFANIKKMKKIREKKRRKNTYNNYLKYFRNK